MKKRMIRIMAAAAVAAVITTAYPTVGGMDLAVVHATSGNVNSGTTGSGSTNSGSTNSGGTNSGGTNSGGTNSGGSNSGGGTQTATDVKAVDAEYDAALTALEDSYNNLITTYSLSDDNKQTLKNSYYESYRTQVEEYRAKKEITKSELDTYVDRCISYMKEYVGEHKKASESSSDTKASDKERETAYLELSSYKENLKRTYDLDFETREKLDTMYGEANAIIAKKTMSSGELSSYVSTVKSQMEALASKNEIKPVESTSAFIKIADNWTTPVATYGQNCSVVLPLINLGTETVTDVVVSPVVSAKTDEWPFEISTTGMERTITEIPATTEQAIAVTPQYRRDVSWTFVTKEKVKNGYYALPFKVTYYRNGVVETADLTTYVKCIGAPGAGEVDGDPEKEGKISTPRIIVTGFETNPEEVYAGDTFQLTIHVKNTSNTKTVSNVIFDLKAVVEGKDADTSYNAFLPTSGSSSIYESSIGPGGEVDLNIEMEAKADLVQKPYVVTLSMEYEDEDANPFKSETEVSIPVKQAAKVETSSVEIEPGEISVGDETNVMFSIYNTGKTTLYNVKVFFEDPAVSGGDAFVGKIQSGGTGNVDTMVAGVAPNEAGIVKATISYEDDAGKVTTMEKDIELIVTESYDIDADSMMGEGDMGGMDMGMMQEPPTGLPVWLVAVIAVVVLAVIVAAILWVRAMRHKKKQAFLAEDLEDTNGPDESLVDTTGERKDDNHTI